MRKNVSLLQFVRFNSTDTSPSISLVKELYKDRLAPVKPFTDKTILSVSNILDLAPRAEFFSQLEKRGKSGLYLIQYKNDPLVYYIGRATQLEYILKSHLNRKLSDKFHVFANIVGWDNFIISIIEICETEALGIRENYYLQKYLPLLNSRYSSNKSETAIFETLVDKFKSLKPLITTSFPTQPRGGTPLRGSEGSLKGVPRTSINVLNKAKKVWVYTVTRNKIVLVNNEPFKSRESAAKFLGTTHMVVRYFIDSLNGKGFNGYYLFSKPLNDQELESLLKLYLSGYTPLGISGGGKLYKNNGMIKKSLKKPFGSLSPPAHCFASSPSLTVKKVNVKYYSTFNNVMKKEEFIDWLRGFIDSEGSFYIEPRNGSFRFVFQIGLHIDDIATLYFIKSQLGIGEIRDRGSNATFSIRTQKDLVKILDILSENTLNTKKYLDFADFKRSFYLYTNSKIKTPELFKEIGQIKRGMNKGRTYLEMPAEFKYRITPYWLLGFVEGDGSFSIAKKDYQLKFIIVQHSRDLVLMQKIRDYLYNLPLVDKETVSKTSIGIRESTASEISYTYLTITHSDIIESVIIPFFSCMSWHSKKLLDFEDFAIVVKLKKEGHHHTHKGKKLIDSILEQMNKSRLTTSGKLKINRELLIEEAKIMLQGPSNYKKEEGKTWIISEKDWLANRKPVALKILDDKGNVIDRYGSIKAVMDFLQLSRYIVLSRLADGDSILWKKGNKRVYIRRE